MLKILIYTDDDDDVLMAFTFYLRQEHTSPHMRRACIDKISIIRGFGVGGSSRRSRSMRTYKHVRKTNTAGSSRLKSLVLLFFRIHSQTHTYENATRVCIVVSKGSQDIYRTQQCFIYTGKIGISRYVCFCLLAELTISYISVNVAVFGVCVRIIT